MNGQDLLMLLIELVGLAIFQCREANIVVSNILYVCTCAGVCIYIMLTPNWPYLNGPVILFVVIMGGVEDSFLLLNSPKHLYYI